MDNLAQTPGTGGPLGQMESDGPPGSKGTASSGGPPGTPVMMNDK